MICYRDMTFCTGDGCTKFDTCPRALTDKVKNDAQRWWGWNGDPAPIARFGEPKKLDCYTPKPTKNDPSIDSCTVA